MTNQINQINQVSQENINQPSMAETTFKDLLSKVQFVVPEIQREYVWGVNKDIIYNFLNSIKDEKNLNIGFLYSYTPNYATSEQKISYLIDGQQRFTTLYLLAFYKAIKDNSCGEFKKIASNFSYRVRHSTVQFLEKLVDKTTSIEDLTNIEDKTWFLSYYKQDISISNMLALIKFLSEYENDLPSYEQIMAVKFYNFNIAATGQGEELYISMNSRGEKIQENENLRAKLFEKLSETSKRNEYAQKYDNWQEFFWRNRDKNKKNSTADAGFNKFIERVKQIEGKDNQNELDFEILKKYFLSLRQLSAFLKSKKIQNVIHCDAKISLVGEGKESFILPLMYLLSCKEYKKWLSLLNFIRFARFFANISYNKGVNAIEEAIKLAKSIVEYDILDPIDLLDNGIENKLLDDEEKVKLKIYRDSSKREDVEKAFYRAEDMKLWAGEISSQISWSKDFNNTFSLDKFLFLNKLFYFIFENEKNTDLLRRVLLARNLENYPIPFQWNKFSFIYEDKTWKELFSQEKNKKFFLELFEEIYRNYIANENSFEKSLQQMISTPSEGLDKYHIELIKRPELLAYCQNKIALWADETGWKLLSKTKTNSHSIHLNTYILFLDRNEIFRNELYHYKNNNGSEVYIGKHEQDDSCVYFDLLDHIAVDVSCVGIKKKFIIEVFSRNSNELSSMRRLELIKDFLKYELNSEQRLKSPELSDDETISTLKDIIRFFSQ